ncbi:hypothetical protein J2T02_000557 [Chitinophaga terrae (ex Kim and Jung 2007)]|uniref:DUF3050 domain-containing protein n=1 Tax=Chitinophaga terrae (ex Kim and Jung 2007) TaxID=408074 RepID=UPI002783ECFA|nr:DUF3050 domain-containing protein [Chitinophaga terrae (ex Kim and Jung 2007)]MDQ0105464.1 hypothetical protein [Chitinophaga terrae (ex Kim and Jung 2007)]
MSIRLIQEAIAPNREKVIAHPLYASLQSLEDVRTFMQFHVYAVWDFMSLLKALQQQLTCVSLPWIPVGNAATRYLINEIVTGEESDIDKEGNRCSHFELYERAMLQAGADCGPIRSLIAEVQQGKNIRDILASSPLPQAVKGFLGFTFDVIATGKAHVMAAVFTFGREDLIPDMFLELVKDLDQKIPGKLDTFIYYLERHIEVDGDHHSQLAMQMVTELCGDDREKWEEAAEYARLSLHWRHELWSGILAETPIF